MAHKEIGKREHILLAGAKSYDTGSSVAYFTKYCARCGEKVYLDKDQIYILAKKAGLIVKRSIRDRLRSLRLPHIRREQGALVLEFKSDDQAKQHDLVERAELNWCEKDLVAHLKRYEKRLADHGGIDELVRMRNTGMSLRAVGNYFDISHEWVRQLEAIKKYIDDPKKA